MGETQRIRKEQMPMPSQSSKSPTLNSRREFLLASAALAAGILAACGGAAAPAPSADAPNSAPATSAAKPSASSAASAAASASPAASTGKLNPAVNLKVAISNSISDSPIIIAQKRGYFDDEGLQVETSVVATNAITPSLASGQLDVATTNISSGMFAAVAQGIPMKLVADKGSNRPNFVYNTIVLRKELADQFKSFAVLKGQKVASSGGAAAAGTYRLDRAMKTAGLSWKDCDMVDLDLASAATALTNGAVSASIVPEPFVTQLAEKGVAMRVPEGDKALTPSQVGVIAYGPHLVAEKAEAANRFMVAYLRGARDYLGAFTTGKDRQAITDILVANTTVKDPALYGKMVLPGTDPNGRMIDSDVEGQQNWFSENGFLKQTVDLKQLIDYQYADYAVSRLGKA
jgi:NitT/TauT family transport system substrate-binding protein